jgi:hypothetical protein
MDVKKKTGFYEKYKANPEIKKALVNLTKNKNKNVRGKP